MGAEVKLISIPLIQARRQCDSSLRIDKVGEHFDYFGFGTVTFKKCCTEKQCCPSKQRSFSPAKNHRQMLHGAALLPSTSEPLCYLHFPARGGGFGCVR